MAELRTVGMVRNKFDEKADLNEIMEHESVIIVDPEYEEGLYRIDESEYIQVIFHFHLSEGYELKGRVRNGRIKGVFASRTPRRPSGIGTTVVKLTERRGSELRVTGLDALNGTRVLDIKPYVPFMDEAGRKRVEEEYRKTDPRGEMNRLIRKEDLGGLLLRAGTLHGHYCPGLAFGVMAGACSVKKLGVHSEGTEDLVAIVETNNCFNDGIQYVTGCTFGNNGLIYRDLGKTAVTLAKRDGEGIRIALRPDARALLNEKYPGSKELFGKVVAEREGSDEDRKKLKKMFGKMSFDIVELDPETLFDVGKVSAEVPDYAPIHDSVTCAECGESVMATRVVGKGENALCLACSETGHFEIDGRGTRFKR